MDLKYSYEISHLLGGLESWDLNQTLYWTKERVSLVSLGMEELRDTHRRSVKDLVHNTYGLNFGS